MSKDDIEQRLRSEFEALPSRLQKAAHYVLASPTAIAMDSMRASAVAAGVQPAVMLRLARHLGFTNYETFRDVYREWVANPAAMLYRRAEALARRLEAGEGAALVGEILGTSVTNLGKALGGENVPRLTRARDLIMQGRRNFVFGIRSLFPAAYYLHYACSTVYDNFHLLSGLGETLVDELRRIEQNDVVVVFSLYPYSKLSAQVAELARERGATVIAITDSVVAPVARDAGEVVLMTTLSPSMFPSILPAMACAEALAALLVAARQEEGLRQVEDLRLQLSRFQIFTNT